MPLNLFKKGNEAKLKMSLKKKIYEYKKSKGVYEGQWLGGFRHGKGKMIFNDQAVYEGDWFLGKANGHGKFTHQHGEIYEGNWVDDRR